jgi:hypothetical protein
MMKFEKRAAPSEDKRTDILASTPSPPGWRNWQTHGT